MPKMLKACDLPKPSPPIDFDSMSRAEICAFLAQASIDPTTWFYKGRCLAGMPWWLETPRPYLTPHEIMFTYKIDRRLFTWLHESGLIPGATYLPRNGRQSKDQPVVDTRVFLERILKDGMDWFLRVNASTATAKPQPGRRPGEVPARTRILELAAPEFAEVLTRSRSVPHDVVTIVQYDEYDRFVASITLNRRGRIAGIFAVDPDYWL